MFDKFYLKKAKSNQIISYIAYNIDKINSKEEYRKIIVDNYLNENNSSNICDFFNYLCRNKITAFSSKDITSILKQLISNILETEDFSNCYYDLLNYNFFSKNDRLLLIDTYSKCRKFDVIIDFYKNASLTSLENDYFISSLLLNSDNKKNIEGFSFAALSNYNSKLGDNNYNELLNYLIGINSIYLIDLSKSPSSKKYIKDIYNAIKKKYPKYLTDFYKHNPNIDDIKDEIVTDLIENSKDDSKYKEIEEFLISVHVSKDKQNELINILIENDLSKAVNVSKNKEILETENLNKIAKKLIKEGKIEDIYYFLLSNCNLIDKDLRKKLIRKIINSKNMYYICLLTIYVDNSLIYIIFNKLEELLLTINSLDIDEDEKKAMKKDCIAILDKNNDKKNKIVNKKVLKRLDKLDKKIK